MKHVMKLLTWTMSFKNHLESTQLVLCRFKIQSPAPFPCCMGMGLHGDKAMCVHKQYYACFPSIRTNRICVETATVGDITIPKGAQIIIPIYELHHDPKYWEEPEKFNPDR